MIQEVIVNSPKYGKNIALVDEEDYIKVSKYTWTLHRNGKTQYAKSRSRGSLVLMHTVITGYDFVDHIDRNGLNNCRNNLRLGNKIKNSANVGLMSTNVSGYRGVHLAKHFKIRPWVAQLSGEGRGYKPWCVVIGRFESPEDAAVAYNEVALEWFGDYAYLNIIEGK